MLYAALAAFGLVLLGGGAWYARKEYYASKPQPIWVQLPLRADISMANQEELAKQIVERLRNDELLRQVVVDAGLQSKFGSPTEDAAVDELKQRLFVKPGTVNMPQGAAVPSINVGVNGNGHQKEGSGAAATRLIKDVYRMMGIDPETGQPLKRPSPAGTPSEDSGFNSAVPDMN